MPADRPYFTVVYVSPAIVYLAIEGFQSSTGSLEPDANLEAPPRGGRKCVIIGGLVNSNTGGPGKGWLRPYGDDFSRN
jgi:hypothetical protein